MSVHSLVPVYTLCRYQYMVMPRTLGQFVDEESYVGGGGSAAGGGGRGHDLLRWGVQRWKQVEERVNAGPSAAAASSDRSTYSPETQE